MAKNYRTGLIITGDPSGGVNALKLTREETKKFNQSTKESRQGTRRWREEVSSATDTAGRYASSLTGLGAVIGGLFGIVGGFSLAGMVSDITTSTRELEAMSASVGVNADTLLTWQAAAKKVGLDSDKMADIFKDVSDKLGDFASTGGGAAADVVERLGLNINELIRLSPDQQLLAIADGLDHVNSQSEKVFLLEALAGDASRLLPLLENNAAAIHEVSRETESLGLSLSEIDTANIQSLSDEIDKTERVIGQMKRQLVAELAPALESVFAGFNEDVEAAGGATKIAADMMSTLATVSVILSGAIGGRLTVALTQATAARIKDTLATQNQARADMAAAAGALQVARSQQTVALTTSQATAAKARAIAATSAYQAAQLRLIGTTRALKGAMAFMGGWPGLLLTAAGAAAAWVSSANDAAGATETWQVRLARLRNDQEALARLNIGEQIAATKANILSLSSEISTVVLNRTARVKELNSEIQGEKLLLAELEKRLANIDQTSSGAAGGTSTLADAVTAIQDPLTDYILQLEREALQIGKNAEQRAALQAQWKAEEMARKALAEAEKAEAEGKKELAQQYRNQAEKIKGAIPLLTRMAAANVKETGAQKKSAAAKEESIKIQKALESAYAKEIKALADQQLKLTLSEREYYRYTLTLRGFQQAQIDAAMAIWDSNQALQSQADAAKDAADALQDAQRDIGNSLTDALLRGFEDGAGLAANFVDTLKNLFNTLILRPIIQPIATGLAGGVTSMLMPSGASAGGLLASPLSSAASSSSSGGLNVLSLASNLFGLAGGSFGAVSSGVTGLIGAGQFADAFSLAGAGLSGSAGIGGALGAVAPFLPIALPLIAGLFKKKPSDKAQWGNVNLSTGEIFGVDGQSGDKFSQENADARDTLLSGFSQFSASLGAVLGEQLEGGIRVIIGNRDGLRLGFDGAARVGEISADEVTNYGRDTEALQQAGYDYIWERFLSAADQFSGSMITLMRGIMDPNDRLASAGAFGAIRTVIDADPVADYAAAVEMTNRTLWQAGQDQFNTIMDLAAAYDGSVSATQELAAATQARYQTELALLAQIDAAISNTDALFASSRQQFELAGLSAEETYNYWKSLADAGAEELATLIDPAAINQQLDEINRQYLSAWGTLGADQQALMKTEYLAYIDDLETLRDERLGAAREQLDDQTAVVARETNQAISAAAERFVEAARRIEEAAAAINQAAATPVPVAVSVDMSNINDLFADVGA